MKKFTLPFLAFFTTAAWSWDPPVPISPETPVLKDGCYQISNAQELFGFSDLVNKEGETNACGILTQDIVINRNLINDDGSLNERIVVKEDSSLVFAIYHDLWRPIGTSENPFAGTFDGAGHTISGVYYRGENAQYVSFFGYVKGSGADTVAVIRNLGLEDSYFDGKAYVGALVGYSARGTLLKIENSYSRAIVNIQDERGYAGGLLGYLASSGSVEITNSYFDGVILGSHASYCGGAIGYAMGNRNFDNVYVSGYGATAGVNSSGVTSYDKSKFEDGTVAARLHAYMKDDVFGSIWGQDALNGETYPRFSGVVNTSAETLSDVVLHTYENDPNASLYSKKYVEGVKFNLPSETVMAREGYIFLGWYNSEDFSGSKVQSIGTSEKGSKEFFAKYATAHTVTLVESEGVNSTVIYGDGTEQLLKTPERKGFVFAGWCDNAELKGTAISKMTVTSDVTLYAKWIEVKTPALVDGCYQISDAGELYGFAALVNGGTVSACGVLTKDIVVNENVLAKDGSLNDDKAYANWTPIGNTDRRFNGTFDGQGHTVSGLYMNGDKWGVGLIGYTQQASGEDTVIVKNVGVIDSYLKGNRYVGGIVGLSGNGEILKLVNCFNASSLTATATYAGIGGLVGYSSGSLTILNSFNSGVLNYTGTEAGGLVGNQYGGSLTVENSYYLKNKANASTGKTVEGAVESEAKDFYDGTIAGSLFKYNKDGVDGTVWGQAIGTRHPDYCGFVEFVKCPVNFHGGEGSLAAEYLSVNTALGKIPEITADEFFERPATAKYSYTYVGWDRELTRNMCTSETVDYYAVYDSTINKYTVSVLVKNADAGSVEGAGTFEYGTEVTLTAVANEGYEFSNWKDDVAALATRTVTVEQDVEYEVSFVEISSSSEPEISSSSSEFESSSSSSEVEVSSSSETEESSSSAVVVPASSGSVSSSSELVESSSSSSKPEESSSSEEKDAVVAGPFAPQFSVMVEGRSLRVVNVPAGASVVLLDMQGRVLYRGVFDAARVNVAVPRGGRYLIRVGHQTKLVNVK